MILKASKRSRSTTIALMKVVCIIARILQTAGSQCLMMKGDFGRPMSFSLSLTIPILSVAVII